VLVVGGVCAARCLGALDLYLQARLDPVMLSVLVIYALVASNRATVMSLHVQRVDHSIRNNSTRGARYSVAPWWQHVDLGLSSHRVASCVAEPECRKEIAGKSKWLAVGSLYRWAR
jgi:hypothetical protein